MVIYEKIKSLFSRNWSLRNRGRHFASSSVYFFSLFVITAVNRSSAVDWLLMPKHLIWWFLISFSGEFVADMAFGKKSKILKTRFGVSIVSGVSLLLGALPVHLFFVWFGFINWWAVLFIEAGAGLLVGCVIQKIFFGKYWVDRYY
ncbi:hypothetical protein [Helicobacter pylori]|uniref:hypothetical protein n=1 Tax=Helicobacter pylori TaxID=210 RepID=UPI0004585CA4|nr:hypothetical protein [Helicobacter pylori]AHZ26647.1 membrane protein [Helicobacter pylori]